jgi:ATP-dependent Clp protease ATP-binding subunit ClpC
MPKINVYLPDDLAAAVKDAGIPVSPVCQRALELAVRRAHAQRQTLLDDLSDTGLAERLQPIFTARAITVLGLAIDRARSRDRSAGAPGVTTGDLLHGLITETANLGRQVLAAMDVEPGSLTAPADAEPALPAPDGAQLSTAAAQPSTDGAGLRFSRPLAAALELTFGESIGLGHNYVGCEHLLIGLVAEPDGAAGALLRSRGLEARSVRRSVAAAVAGYAHLRNTETPRPADREGLLAAVRAEIAPLIARIESLESRVS